VFASGLYYAFYNALAAENHSVGTPEDPGLYINGGANKNVEISSNTATENGGGVYVVGLKDTRKAQIYNAVIKNNTADKGAGVINNRYWTQLDIDGCNITGNSATSNGG
jgi:predicted outer membrane repeat protein